MKNIRVFIFKFSIFGGEIFYILNRRVFVMWHNPNAKATHIFSAKILTYTPYLMIKVLKIR